MSATHYIHDPTLHRVFGRAVNIDPSSLFNAVKDEPPTELQPTRITQAVDYLRENHLRPDDPILELHSSFYDVRMIMHTALDNADPPLSIQEALGVATHDRSSKLMAQLALCPSEYYTDHILEDPSILLIESRQYVDIVPGILPDRRIGKGCPFAGDNLEKSFTQFF